MFVNPIEMLNLSVADVDKLDERLIKKAKRSLISQIELDGDGFFDYHGTRFTKSQCEQFIDELDDVDKRFFYRYLIFNQDLNNFLVCCDEQFLYNFSNDELYSNPSFIKFINPSFAENIDFVLCKAFKSKDSILLDKILATQSLIESSFVNLAFRSLSNEIRTRIEDIKQIKNEVENETTDYTENSIKKLAEKVIENFPAELLNKLPPYFQGQLNKIAESINYLQLAVWNEFNDTYVPFLLSGHILKLNIKSVSKPIFEKNYQIIKAKHHEQIEKAKFEPELKEWALIIKKINQLCKKVENNEISADTACKDVKDMLFVTTVTKSINEAEKSSQTTIISSIKINSLPEHYQELKNILTISIRSLAIECWNKQQKIDIAIFLVELALKIVVDVSLKEKLIKDNCDLTEIRKEVVKEQMFNTILNAERYATTSPQPTPVEEQKGSWVGLLFVIILIAFIIGAIIYGHLENNSSWPSQKTDYKSYVPKPYVRVAEPAPTFNQPLQPIPSNGYALNYTAKQCQAPFEIKTPYGSSYYYILLKSVTTNEKVVSIFMHPGSKIQIKVPLGDYSMYYASGKQWYGTKYLFGPDTIYSKADDVLEFYQTNTSIMGNTIELIEQVGGNLSTSPADKGQFVN